ncbi:hypothetical protein EDD58_1185 [Hazenella coriacea]|uniref:Uncharacterized protein n=1 Tax=Hazenella coriacea TaxID=1179467 RepID=A0A4R3L3E0_9BACL|nr:hypothetical protein EDD58_1185 [Hazenella coriacea]
MDDTLFVVLIVTILLVTATLVLSFMIWAEKTNSLLVRLAILVPFYH